MTFGIRPEHIDVAEPTADLDITVDLVEQLGGETYLYAIGAGPAADHLRQDGQAAIPPRRRRLALRAAADPLHMFDADRRGPRPTR